MFLPTFLWGMFFTGFRVWVSYCRLCSGHLISAHVLSYQVQAVAPSPWVDVNKMRCMNMCKADE